MLTSGIEYFGAPSDEAAIAFAEGRAADAPPLVRADGIRPENGLAVFGALLTAQPIAVLSSAPELETLSVEERKDGVVTLLRLPRSTSAALASSTPEELEEAGRRTLVYAAPGQADAVVIARLLAGLAECARAGQLYARVVEPERSSPSHRPRSLPWRRLLPIAGMIAAPVLLVTGFALSQAQVGMRLPFLIAAGLVLGTSVGAFLRVRADDRIRAVADETDGSLVTMLIADEHFEHRLGVVAQEVLGIGLPADRRRGPHVDLVVDPAGATVRFDDVHAVAFPAAVVLGISARGDASPGLTFVLRVTDEESELWEVSVVDARGTPVDFAQVSEIAATFAAILGSRNPDRDRATPR